MFVLYNDIMFDGFNWYENILRSDMEDVKLNEVMIIQVEVRINYVHSLPNIKTMLHFLRKKNSN